MRGARSQGSRIASNYHNENCCNAATSLAAAVGSALAGVIFGDAGFTGLAATACVAVASAVALSALWLKEWRGTGGM
jgi:hypothetical protein